MRVSLKWRVGSLVAAVLVAVIVTISTAAYYGMRESLFRGIDQSLSAMGQGILASLDDPGTEEETNAELRRITGADQRRRPNHFRIWIEGQQHALFTSDPQGQFLPAAEALSSQPAPAAGGRTFFDGRPHEETRCLWLRAETRRGLVNVLVQQSSHNAYDEMGEYLRLLILLSSGAVAGSAILVMFLVSWALRPIGKTASTLLHVTAKDVGSVALDDHAVPPDLQPFVRSVSDMLARLDKSMRRQKLFVADASHELRTPLALAKSTLQAAQGRERSAKEYQQALDETLEDLDRLERLIQDLLMLARLDETNGPPEVEKLELSTLLQSVCDSRRSAIAATGGSLRCDPPPMTVFGNAGELGRLFGNLLDNAIKYGPRGGTFEVSASPRRSEPNPAVHVCVRDQGGNIPAEALPRLFDRFYRVDPSRSYSAGGAGLGLSIAREIALRHGGDISVTSDRESGTCVTVRLPLADAAQPAASLA